MGGGGQTVPLYVKKKKKNLPLNKIKAAWKDLKRRIFSSQCESGLRPVKIKACRGG